VTERRRLPTGITPRLLSKDAAAAYCGVVAETFEKHVRPHVPPTFIGTRALWDVKVIDRWIDERSRFAEPVQPIEYWLDKLRDQRPTKRQRKNS
jgi:hypothetical protein